MLSGPIRVCTLFDSNFSLQGIAMIESVENCSSELIEWTILALDESVYRFLIDLNRQNFQVLRFNDLEDPELMALIHTRAWNEVCWTSAACLLNFSLRSVKADQRIAYIDADCYFFSDLSTFFEDAQGNCKIFIHEHNFSSDRLSWLPKSGRFNVGVVGGIKSKSFESCIAYWREQVLDDCSVDPKLGKCGDQTYLNNWPELFGDLCVVQNPGVGVAPWNLNNYSVTINNDMPYVNGVKSVFFHFHGLKIVFITKYLSVYFTAPGYNFIHDPDGTFYKPYISHLMKLKSQNLYVQKGVRKVTFRWFVNNISLITLTKSLVKIPFQ